MEESAVKPQYEHILALDTLYGFPYFIFIGSCSYSLRGFYAVTTFAIPSCNTTLYFICKILTECEQARGQMESLFINLYNYAFIFGGLLAIA